MPALTFTDARSLVLREVGLARTLPSVETVLLEASYGRVLAEDAIADRDYPPFNRSMRDGFAVCHQDMPGTVRIIGEVRAGESFEGRVDPGQAVEIMTGAPVPPGATAVVMVENCTMGNDNGAVMSSTESPAEGANISPAGCEAKHGEAAIRSGARIDHAVIAWLASIGLAQVSVYRQLRVAIVATGDELVGISETPLHHQIRNSNTYSLAAQVIRAGAVPVILEPARDNLENTREQIRRGLEADLLLISGGVSAGKYDLVETVLAELGAVFFFDRVMIQPGAPVVFGKAFGKAFQDASGKFFFGLPGNPASTMATFELFARAAIDLLSGASDAPLPLLLARLTKPFRHKGGLTRFLPATLACGEITPLDSKGSGDVPSLARANAYLVADASQREYLAGELIPVLLK